MHLQEEERGWDEEAMDATHTHTHTPLSTHEEHTAGHQVILRQGPQVTGPILLEYALLPLLFLFP